MALSQEQSLEESTSASPRSKSNGIIRWFANSSPMKNNEKPPRVTPERTKSSTGARRRQTSKVTQDQQSEEEKRIAELERKLEESQERVQQLEAAASQKPSGKMPASIADKSNEGVFEASQSQSHHTIEEPIVNDATTKPVPVTPDVSKKGASPSSVNKQDHNHGVTKETLAKSDDEESLDQELDPETNISSWHGIALESAVCAELIPPYTEYQLQTPRIIPPTEVLAICEPPESFSEVDGLDFKIKLEDAQLRAQAYRCKLEAAEDLIASLFRDMEKARRSVHLLVTRNVKLAGAIRGIRLDQEEHYIGRSSLVKVCMYISPVFMLCGGLEYFVSTIILVWVFLELEAAVYPPAEDDEEEGEQRKKKSRRHSKKKRPESPIPPPVLQEDASASF
jgi:hypothetical protein